MRYPICNKLIVAKDPKQVINSLFPYISPGVKSLSWPVNFHVTELHQEVVFCFLDWERLDWPILFLRVIRILDLEFGQAGPRRVHRFAFFNTDVDCFGTAGECGRGDI